VTLPHLAVSPVQASYSAEFPGAISTALDGPRGRYRKVTERNPIDLPVSWVVDAYGFQYLRSFFRGPCKKGAVPFTIDLVVESQAEAAHVAHFVPGTFTLESMSGQAFTVSATLEVLPNPANDAYDASLFAVGQAFGDDVPESLDLLSRIVNISWPAA